MSQREPGETQQGGRGLGGGAIVSLSGLAVLVIFVIQNTEDIRFDFLFIGFTWPLWLYTIMVALFGALVSGWAWYVVTDVASSVAKTCGTDCWPRFGCEPDGPIVMAHPVW